MEKSYLCGMKIVLAFDSFKGCLSAEDVCRAAKEGILSVREDAEVVSMPLSDGGEGLVQCFLRMGKAREVSVKVHGPLMEEVEATYALSHDGETAYMEMASACGLTLVPEDKRNVMDATTYGLGEMMADAWERGVRHIVLSTRSILTIACDVDNPLYGEEGAAYVFAPQKGANPEQVKLLDERLKAFAKETEEQGMATPEDAFHPGAGAAGGLGYALLTYLGAELKQGVDVVLDACEFDDVLKGGDVVITGEGCSDEQTTRGKVAAGVLKRAKQQGVKTVLMSGQIKEREMLVAYGFDTLYGINEGEERPLSELMNPDVAKENIRKTCQRMMQEGI